jgi:hypothetical protein
VAKEIKEQEQTEEQVLYQPPFIDLENGDNAGVKMKNGREVGFYLAGTWQMWTNPANEQLYPEGTEMRPEVIEFAKHLNLSEVRAKFNREYLGGALSVLVQVGAVVSIYSETDTTVTLSIV